jgi:hypothetical protein
MSATEMARAKRSILTSSHRDIGPHIHLHPAYILPLLVSM